MLFYLSVDRIHTSLWAPLRTFDRQFDFRNNIDINSHFAWNFSRDICQHRTQYTQLLLLHWKQRRRWRQWSSKHNRSQKLDNWVRSKREISAFPFFLLLEFTSVMESHWNEYLDYTLGFFINEQQIHCNSCE